MSKRWYVVQAYSGYEKRVKEAIEEAVRLEDLGSFFGEIMVPTEEVIEMKSGKKRKSERKFFPGYVLVEMEMTEKTWQLVRNVPRVTGFVGVTTEKPAPITEADVERIMQRMQDSVDKPKPKRLFSVGEVVRVTDGPFLDFSGVVEEVNYEKSRVRVSVSIFGRSTPVELEFSQIEKEEV